MRDGPVQQELFLGRFIGWRPIGAGRFSEVYKGFDCFTNELVAFKVLRREQATDANVRRFADEARLARGLCHDNIGRVHDVGEFEGTRYLTMEFLGGLTLRELMRRARTEEREISTLDALRIVAQVCSALEYAHRRRIVHLDVKPENVFVLKDGTVKLVDFSIAKHLDEADLGALAGTPEYMAPEQFGAGDGLPVDHAADIFALGVILFELLTGTRPFTGGQQMVSVHPKPPSRLRRGLPHGCDDLVLRALRMSRTERFANATVMLAAINALERQITPVQGDDQSGSAAAEKGGPPRTIRAPARWALAVTAAVLLVAAAMPLSRSLAIRRSLSLARAAHESGAVWKGERDSEVSLLLTVVRRQPGHAEASQRLRAAFEMVSTDVIDEIVNGHLEAAATGIAVLHEIEKALTLSPAARRTLLVLERRLSAAREPTAVEAKAERAEVDRLLGDAERLMRGSLSVPPSEPNALGLYRQVLKLDPGNAQAKGGIARIQAALLARAQAAVRGKRIDDARRDLAIASQLEEGDPAVRSQVLRLDLELRRQAAKDPRPDTSSFR